MRMHTKTALGAMAAVITLASSGAGAATPKGRAWSDGVLMRLQVADTLVQIGMDQLSAARAKEASAVLTLASNGADQIGQTQTRSKGPKQSESMQTGTVDLGQSVSASVTSGGLEAWVKGQEAVSSVSTRMSDADVAFTASLGTIAYDMTAWADDKESTASRHIEISDMVLLRLRDLLDQLGFGILGYTCEEVTTIALNLGIDSSSLCSDVASAESAIAQAVTMIEGAEADARALRDTTIADLAVKQAARDASDAAVAVLTTQRDNLAAAAAGLDASTLNATVAALTVLCPTLIGTAQTTCQNDLATAQAGLATLASLTAAEAALTAEQTMLAGIEASIAALEATLAQIGALLDLLTGLTAGDAPTCDDATAALEGVAAAVPALASESSALRTQIATVCNLLKDTLDTILDTPLLSMKDLSLDLVASGTEGEATALATGSLGALVIGVLPPLELDLVLGEGLGDVETASATATGLLRETLGSLGLDVTDLSLELLKFERETNVEEDGSSAASSSVSILALELPALSVEFPGVDPLGFLGTGGPAGLPEGSVTTPPISLAVANFQAASNFQVTAVPPGGGGTSGSSTTLPVTGTEDYAFIAISAIFLATSLRRWLRGVEA